MQFWHSLFSSKQHDTHEYPLGANFLCQIQLSSFLVIGPRKNLKQRSFALCPLNPQTLRAPGISHAAHISAPLT